MSPVVFDALADIAFVAAGSALNFPLGWAVRRFMQRRVPKVDIKFKSGRTVELEVDPRLSTEKVSALVQAAVTSANAGDEAGIQRVVEESRAASRAARAAALAS